MTLRNLPAAPALTRPRLYQPAEVSDPVHAAWAILPAAAAAEADGIAILEPIGPDPYGEGGGVTAAAVAAALRRHGNRPVVVTINSPGGDLFEGLAIHNLLRAHPAAVAVRIVGLAASAASIIAMAGDRIEMGSGAFLMIHNAWGMVVGNRHEMRDLAETFDAFDAAMAAIYAARSGLAEAEVAALMDATSWIGAERAVALGLADVALAGDAASAERRARLLAGARPAAASVEPMPALEARRRIDQALARSGMSRAERRQLQRALGEPGTPAAPAFDLAAAARLIERVRAAGD
ncbi:MAG: Clp protease ClpP [Geminicoccaceae bacterium]